MNESQLTENNNMDESQVLMQSLDLGQSTPHQTPQ